MATLWWCAASERVALGMLAFHVWRGHACAMKSLRFAAIAFLLGFTAQADEVPPLFERVIAALHPELAAQTAEASLGIGFVSYLGLMKFQVDDLHESVEAVVNDTITRHFEKLLLSVSERGGVGELAMNWKIGAVRIDYGFSIPRKRPVQATGNFNSNGDYLTPLEQSRLQLPPGALE